MLKHILIFVFISSSLIQSQITFQKTYGDVEEEECEAVVQTEDGGFILAGRKDGAIVGDSDFYLVKTDSAGDLVWDRTYGGDDADRAFTAMQTSDGGYILGGFTASFNVEYYDFYLVKTDSSGDTIWTKTYGGLWQEEIADIEETSDGGYAAVGYTYSFGAGSNPNIYFVKIDANGLITDVNDHNNTKDIHLELNQNYPNPFNPITKIKYTVGDSYYASPVWVTLKVFDVLGNEIGTLVNGYKPAGKYEVEFNPSSINHHPTSGIYFYQLKAGAFIHTKKMILLK